MLTDKVRFICSYLFLFSMFGKALMDGSRRVERPLICPVVSPKVTTKLANYHITAFENKNKIKNYFGMADGLFYQL